MATDKIEMLFPPTFLLTELYKNLYDNLLNNVTKKLKDANTLKSNLASPHNRQVTITSVPRVVFTAAFSKKLILPEENSQLVMPDEKISPLFVIATLKSSWEVFGGESLVKILPGGDVTVVTPWLILTSPVITENETFDIGRLLIPLEINKDFVKVFIPCAGPDPETDETPLWCKSYTLNDIIPLKPE